MGDTGSLALGGALAGGAIVIGAQLLLPLIGGVFAAEALSVIMQVASFKTHQTADLSNEPTPPSLRARRLAGNHASRRAFGWHPPPCRGSASALAARTMNPPIKSGLFDRNERVLVIGLGRSGRASIAVLQPRVAAMYATDEAPGIDAAALGVPFVAPAALGRRAAQRHRRRVVAGHSAQRRTRAAHSDRGRAGIQRSRGRVSDLQRADRRGDRDERQVDDGGAARRNLPARRQNDVRRRQHRQRAHRRNRASPAPDDWVIAEVSSFQLESIRSFKPRIALINNISPDHLDRYFSMDEYAEAKFRIFANQGPGDTFVGNLDDERIAALAGEDANRIKARALWFAGEPHRNTTLYVRGEQDDRVRAADRRSAPGRDHARRRDSAAGRAQRRKRARRDSRRAWPPVSTAKPMAAAVRAFKPLGHRLQVVAEREGVTYVDDSKATNPGSVIAALRSFDRPIVLIAGGKAKGTEFADLGRVASSRTKAVVVIGEAAEAIAKTIKRAAVHRAGSMDEAVAIAASVATAGDIVLLSPGCASFDMFASAEDRGKPLRGGGHGFGRCADDAPCSVVRAHRRATARRRAAARWRRPFPAAWLRPTACSSPRLQRSLRSASSWSTARRARPRTRIFTIPRITSNVSCCGCSWRWCARTSPIASITANCARLRRSVWAWRSSCSSRYSFRTSGRARAVRAAGWAPRR